MLNYTDQGIYNNEMEIDARLKRMEENRVIMQVLDAFDRADSLNANNPNHQIALYRAYNDESGDYYHGATTRKDKRIYEHTSELKRGVHNPRFQKSFDKNPNFHFTTIPVIDSDSVFAIEKIILKACKGDPHCLNLKDSFPSPVLGIKQSEQDKQRKSEAQLLRYKNNPQLIEAARKRRMGIKQSIETISKRAKKPIGKKLSPEHIYKTHKPTMQPVSCEGNEYESYNAAARALNTDASTIWQRVTSNNPKFAKYFKIQK